MSPDENQDQETRPTWVVAGTPIDEEYPEELEDAWYYENRWWVDTYMGFNRRK